MNHENKAFNALHFPVTLKLSYLEAHLLLSAMASKRSELLLKPELAQSVSALEAIAEQLHQKFFPIAAK
jgi:hypothetical protein